MWVVILSQRQFRYKITQNLASLPPLNSTEFDEKKNVEENTVPVLAYLTYKASAGPTK